MVERADKKVVTTKPKPCRTKLIDLITGVNPVAARCELDSLEGVALGSHGLVQADGIDRNDTLGDSRALQVESDYQGSIGDPLQGDDLVAQRACDEFRRVASLADVILRTQGGMIEDRRALVRLVHRVASESENLR